jgi:D-3-phosphoglycerate dehydrogenase / 2-oxoglutarate reductase
MYGKNLKINMHNKRLLANDGIESSAKEKIENAGIEVITDHIPQDQLKEKLNQFDAISVRSATKVRKDLIDACPNLKLICRGGVGMDNIDVDYALSKGLKVFNTPASSSTAVAELVFALLFGASRFIYQSGAKMPKGEDFSGLKKAFAKGIELYGKTLGIVGFGRIGQDVARIAKGIGMNVVAFDIAFNNQNFLETVDTKGVEVVDSVDILCAKSDFITLHVPGGDLIANPQFELMKTGVGIINTSRGGVVNENDLIEYLNNGKVAFACLDVFVGEPNPDSRLLQHPNVIATPHIGASTNEAQNRIGNELAEIIIRELS